MNTDNKRPITKYKPTYTSNYNDNAWEVRVSLPGVAKEDIEVKVEKDVLEITGLRKKTTPEGWRRLSGSDQDYQYRLRLDVGPEVDDQGIEAKLENGELLIQLPLREEAKSRQILIK